MKKIYLIILILLSFNSFSLSKEKKIDSECPKLKIEADKNEYIQGQSIKVLYEISADRNYKFCIKPKHYVFFMNMETIEGKSLTSNRFINLGMITEKPWPHYAHSPYDFIDLERDESNNKIFVFRSYVLLSEIIGTRHFLFLSNLNNLEPGTYNLQLKIVTFTKKIYSNDNIIEYQDAWVGKMISNTIKIKIVEDIKNQNSGEKK